MQEENWKDVVGYEGVYEVSNMGKVRSAGRSWRAGYGHVINRKGKLLTNVISTTGYYKVTLCRNRIQKMGSVHRLVAQAFITNPDGKLFVNHIDGNRLNNEVTNLEWCTPSENIRHADKIGLRKIPKGKDHPFYGKSKNGKPVIDNATGKIYKSAKEAANVAGIIYSSFAGMLNGMCKNKTEYEYLKY